MRGTGKISVMVLALLIAAPCLAQYSGYDETPRWHLNGSIGLDLAGGNSNTSSEASPPSQSGNLEYGGDIRMVGSGFLKDPRLLDFTASVTQLRAVSNQDQAVSALGTSATGISFTGTFLNGRGSPLSISYLRSSLGSSGFGGTQNDLISSLGLTWKLRLHRVPALDFSYRSGDYNTSTPGAFAANDTTTKNFSLATHGSVDHWNYSGDFGKGWQDAKAVGNLNLFTPLKTDFSNADAHVDRSLWDSRGEFDASSYYTTQDSSGLGENSSSSLLGVSSNLGYRFSEKVLTHSTYTFSRSAADITFSPNSQLGPASAFVQPDTNQHDIDSGLNYLPLHGLVLTGGVHYTLLSPIVTASEYVSSLLRPYTGISANHHWRGFDFGAGYTISINRLTTNLGNNPQSLGHAVQAMVGWGNVKRFRLSGTYSLNDQGVPQVLGAFSHYRHLGVQAETAALEGWRFRARGDYGRSETLSISGNLSNVVETASFQAEQRRFSVTFAQAYSSGFGSIFQTPFVPPGQFVYSLPLSTLINTPLLDHTSHGTSLIVSAYLMPNLTLNGTWMHESDKFSTLNQTSNNLILHAVYHYGKFIFEGGYQKYGNDYLTLPQVLRSQANANRYYIRIARNFSFF